MRFSGRFTSLESLRVLPLISRRFSPKEFISEAFTALKKSKLLHKSRMTKANCKYGKESTLYTNRDDLCAAGNRYSCRSSSSNSWLQGNLRKYILNQGCGAPRQCLHINLTVSKSVSTRPPIVMKSAGREVTADW